MATWTNFDIPFFADRALQGFVSTLVPLKAFCNNFGPDPVQKGSNVLVPLIGSVTATTFNNSYAVCGGTASVITVTINRHRISQVGQTDLTAMTSSKAMLSSFAYQAGAGLGLVVFQDIMSLLTTANYAQASAVAAGSFTIAEIRKGRLLMNQQKAPSGPRALILDNTPYDALIGATQFVQAQIAGNTEAFRDGNAGRAFGCDIWETNALPGTNSVMGFIAHPSAIAVANRYLDPGVGTQYYIEARPVTDPDTGLTLGLRHHYDPNTGTEYVNLECTYGYAAGITNGARLYSRSD